MKYKTLEQVFGVNLNLKEYSDCWQLDYNKEPIHNPFTNEILIDFEKLKQKYVTEKYKLDLDIQKGKYVEKAFLESYIRLYCQQLHLFCEILPGKVMPLFKAEIEKIIGKEMTTEEIINFKQMLKDEESTICADILQEIKVATN